MAMKEVGRIDSVNRALTPEDKAQIAQERAQEIREERIFRKLWRSKLRAAEARDRARRDHDLAEIARQSRERHAPALARLQEQRDALTGIGAALDQVGAEVERLKAVQEKRGLSRWN
ncbi:hypothetical protein ACWIGW_44490 [Nocardia brasiliensis]